MLHLLVLICFSKATTKFIKQQWYALIDKINVSLYNNYQESNMDTINLIRSFSFFVPGIAMLLFPEKVYNFQIYLIKKLGIKYNVE